MNHLSELSDLGAKLVEKAVDVYTVQGREVVSRWFHSGQDLDCMLWFSEKSDLVRFQMNLHGQIVDWSQSPSGATLQTGFISEEEIGYGGGDVQVIECVVYDEVLNCQSVETVFDLLASISGFRDEWKAQIVAALRQGLKVSGKELRSFGARRATRAPFWSRLKRLGR